MVGRIESHVSIGMIDRSNSYEYDALVFYCVVVVQHA